MNEAMVDLMDVEEKWTLKRVLIAALFFTGLVVLMTLVRGYW